MSFDFPLSAADEQFREEVRAFLRDRLPPDMARRNLDRRPLDPRGHARLDADPRGKGLVRAALAGGIRRDGLDAQGAAHLPGGGRRRRRAARSTCRRPRSSGRSSTPSAPRSRRRGSSPRSATARCSGPRASRSRMPGPTWPRSRPAPCATATTTSSTARRPGPRRRTSPTGCSCWSAPTRRRRTSGRGSPSSSPRPMRGDHDPPHHLDRRRHQPLRDLPRGRARAGGEPGRRGRQGLDLRQLPPRQRAHHHGRGAAQQARPGAAERAGAGAPAAAGARLSRTRPSPPASPKRSSTSRRWRSRSSASSASRRARRGRPTASTLKLRGTEILQGLMELQVETLGSYGAVSLPVEPGAERGRPPRPAGARGRQSRHGRIPLSPRRDDLWRDERDPADDHRQGHPAPGRDGRAAGALSDDQRMIADAVRRFAERSYGFEDRGKRLAAGDAGIRETWRAYAEMGWLAMGLSEQSGGLGSPPEDIAIVLEGLGGALAVEPYLSGAVLAPRAVEAAGAEQAATCWSPWPKAPRSSRSRMRSRRRTGSWRMSGPGRRRPPEATCSTATSRWSSARRSPTR